MPRRRRRDKEAEPGERMAASEPAEPGLRGPLGPSTTAVHAGEPRPKPAHALATPPDPALKFVDDVQIGPSPPDSICVESMRKLTGRSRQRPRSTSSFWSAVAVDGT